MNICFCSFLQYLKKFGCVGPPVYFVLKHGYNFTDLDMQNKICSHLGCNKDALLIQLKLASQIPNRYVMNLVIVETEGKL